MIKYILPLMIFSLSGCSVLSWVPFVGDDEDEKKLQETSLSKDKVSGYCYQQFNDKDYAKAIKSCSGIEDPEAYYDMAFMYSRGKGIEVNYFTAHYLLEKAANNGHVEAMYELGMMYDRGIGGSQDFKLAFKWYKKAADLGHVKAMNNLASLYYCGDGVKQDPKTALFWYYRTAQKGNAEGMYNVGVLLDANVKNSEIYPNDSLYWYKNAAKLGEHNAQFILAKQDYEKNHKKSDLAIIKEAAIGGSNQAANYLGDLFLKGKIVKKSSENAFCWYYLSSTRGSSESINKLKNMTKKWSDAKFDQVKTDCEKKIGG